LKSTWANPEKNGVIVYRGSIPFFIDSGKEYDDLVAFGPDDFVPTKLQSTPAQMRLTLHRAGLLSTVQAIADSDPEAKIVWEYATVILRDSPFIAALSSQSGLTENQIDDLFYMAMSS
jgi:hypothetical protein